MQFEKNILPSTEGSLRDGGLCKTKKKRNVSRLIGISKSDGRGGRRGARKITSVKEVGYFLELTK